VCLILIGFISASFFITHIQNVKSRERSVASWMAQVTSESVTDMVSSLGVDELKTLLYSTSEGNNSVSMPCKDSKNQDCDRLFSSADESGKMKKSSWLTYWVHSNHIKEARISIRALDNTGAFVPLPANPNAFNPAGYQLEFECTVTYQRADHDEQTQWFKVVSR
jgi:hypothetical protein